MLPIDEIISKGYKLIIYNSSIELKYNEETTVTAAIKNITMGYPNTSVHRFQKKNTYIHDGLYGFIISLTDPVVADSGGFRLLVFLLQRVTYLYGLYKDGLKDDYIEGEKNESINM